MDPENDLDFLTIRMPNGRKLYYAKPHMGVNRFGRPSLCYWGMNQTTKKWEVVETYGGKLAENITQAAARDCLAEAIDRLEAAGYPVVFHIHDEVVIDAPPGWDSLEEVCLLYTSFFHLVVIELLSPISSVAFLGLTPFFSHSNLNMSKNIITTSGFW